MNSLGIDRKNRQKLQITHLRRHSQFYSFCFFVKMKCLTEKKDKNEKDPKLILKRRVLKGARLNEPQVFLKLINDLTNDDVAKNDE